MGEAGLYYGHQPRDCGEHRTVGPHRAWCHDCGEWCYPDAEMACKGCRIPLLEAAIPVAADLARPSPRVYSFTRDELIDVLARLEVYPVGAPLARPSVVVAFAMLADAIIEALETERRRAFRAGVRADASEAGKSAAREGDWPDRGTAENAP